MCEVLLTVTFLLRVTRNAVQQCRSTESSMGETIPDCQFNLFNADVVISFVIFIFVFISVTM